MLQEHRAVLCVHMWHNDSITGYTVQGHTHTQLLSTEQTHTHRHAAA